MALTTNAQASSSRGARVVSPDENEPSDDEQRIIKPEKTNGDDDGPNMWTVDTYEPQELGKDPQIDSALNKLLSDMKSMQQSLADGMSKVTETAVALEECSPDDDAIEDLAKSLCRSIEIKHVLKIKSDVLKAMQAGLRRGEAINDPLGTWQKQTADKTEEYMKKTARQKFGGDADYNHFRSEVWEVGHSNTACPPISRWLEKEEGDVSDEDDDVEIGPALQNYKCSASQLPIKDAVVNPACKHHYSKMYVEQLFDQQGRARRQPIQCPSVGCKVMIVYGNLQADKAFQAKADQHFQRESQRAADAAEEYEDITQDD